MFRPNIYNLGNTTELMVYVLNEDGVAVLPSEARITIEVPDTTTVTVSGAAMTVGDGYLSYLYTPTVSGWYSYEAWAKDDYGNEAAKSHAFSVVDRI